MLKKVKNWFFRTIALLLISTFVITPSTIFASSNATVRVYDSIELRDAIISGTAGRTISLQGDIYLNAWTPLDREQALIISLRMIENKG